jgi:predicted MFS family arabinose efflux permease
VAGVMNNSEQIILDSFHKQGKEYDNVEWGTAVSCFGVGGLIGSVVGPKILGRYCGRKTTLMINNVFLVISSALIVSAPQWYWQAIGRIFSGIVAGVGKRILADRLYRLILLHILWFDQTYYNY